MIAINDLDVAQATRHLRREPGGQLTAVMNQKSLEAPFGGTIGIPQVDVGQFVDPGTVYATLQDLDSMRVDFSIPEQDIRLIAIDMPVTVSTEVGNTELTGHISAIEPKIDPNSRLVTVRAEVDDPAHRINPGQFLRVRVSLPEEPNVVALPQTVLSLDALRRLGLRGAHRGRGGRREEDGRAGLRQRRPPLARPGRDRRGPCRAATRWSPPGRTG